MSKSLLSLSDKDILDNFRKQFSHLKNEPIVLYGLGEKTKLILDYLNEYNVVALMDKNSIGAKVFSKLVILPEEVSKLSKNIIIVAAYSSVEIIYRRISYLKSQGVNIYYMNGEKLDFETKADEGFKYDLSIDDLKTAILNNDIISFDIFDTLITRKLPHPSDIFQVVQSKLERDFNIKTDFVSARIQAEKAAQKIDKDYSINEIYNQLKLLLNMPDEDIQLIKNIEIQSEIDFSAQREGMPEVIDFAVQNNKKVVLTSDMYLNKQIIEKILTKCGYNNDFDINISTDTKKSKYSGDIFEYYSKKFNNLKLLHVGDDDFSDIQQAEKKGFQVFKILSKANMYDAIMAKKIMPLMSNMQLSIDDKIVFGHFLSYCFSNPFEISESNSFLTVKSIKDIGYLFFGPLIYNYMVWLHKSVKDMKLDKILFISRDGYILNKLYQKLPEPKFDACYFLTSRRAAGVCAIEAEEDISSVFDAYYLEKKILVSQFVNSAFGIELVSTDTLTQKFLTDLKKEELKSYIIKNYGKIILNNAKHERDEYNKYIENSGIKPKEKIAVINLVGTGVTQIFLEKIFKDNELNMFYFATTIDMKNIKVDLKKVFALYGDFLSIYTSIGNALIKHFLMTEAVFSSPQEQFIKFKNQIPVFKEECGERDFNQIEICHEGIEMFFSDMIREGNFESAQLNPYFTNMLFGTLFMDSIFKVSDDIKSAFVITDGFSSGKVLKGLW